MTFFFAEICAKRVELIKEAVPAATRLGVLVNPANPSGKAALTAMQRTARALRVELLTVDVRAVDDIAGAFAMLASRGAQALTFIEDPLLISNAQYIAQLATQNRLPMIGGGDKPAVEAGALMAYGADRYDLWFRTAFFVDKILKGTPACGFADRPSRKIRANHQPQDRQGARPHDTPAVARTRRRVDRVGAQMSALGTKRTSLVAPHMSAFGGRADMTLRGNPLLPLWGKADMPFCAAHVRF